MGNAPCCALREGKQLDGEFEGTRPFEALVPGGWVLGGCQSLASIDLSAPILQLLVGSCETPESEQQLPFENSLCLVIVTQNMLRVCHIDTRNTPADPPTWKSPTRINSALWIADGHLIVTVTSGIDGGPSLLALKFNRRSFSEPDFAIADQRLRDVLFTFNSLITPFKSARFRRADLSFFIDFHALR